MTLKYKVGDVVVLAENVDRNRDKTFVPGVAVKIEQLCSHNSNDEHYTVSLVSDPSDYWYIMDKEINHNTTAFLQMSNESGYLVQKISVENAVVSSQKRKKVIDAISDVLIEAERMSSYTDVATYLYESGLRFVEEGVE